MDLIDEWARAQARVIALVAPLTAEQAAVRVPACPDWTVRDLFSHMVGLGADVVAGDEPDDHNAAWTEKQVASRRDHDVAALVAEWEGLSGPLQEWMRANNTRPLSDVIIHEQDLRGALGVPGGQDSGGVAAVRDRFLPRFGARVADLPPIALVGDGFSWASAGDPDAADVRGPRVRLRPRPRARHAPVGGSAAVVDGARRRRPLPRRLRPPRRAPRHRPHRIRGPGA